MLITNNTKSENSFVSILFKNDIQPQITTPYGINKVEVNDKFTSIISVDKIYQIDNDMIDQLTICNYPKS